MEKVHRIINFNQKAWLKPYTDMNTDLRKKSKKIKNQKSKIKINKKRFGLMVKTYSYLIDDGNEDKKPKSTKKCVIKK